ncbi:hypothetical protein [Neomoorella glycerini]|nr:hypothetical protein [Moorella glycerini]
MQQLKLNFGSSNGEGVTDVKSLLSQQFFSKLEKDGKIEYMVRETNFLLYLTRVLDTGTFLCKFARGLNLKRHTPGEKDIESIIETNYPYIYIVIDKHHQIIMLQKKTTVFRNIDQAKNSFHSFLVGVIGAAPFEISINDITSIQQFWKCIKEAEAVFYVRFHLKTPNLWGFSEEASNLLRKVKESINNTSLELKFENENGQLHIEKDSLNIGSLADYASGGGGSWDAKIRRSGETSPVTVSSREYKRSIQLFSDLELEEPERIVQAVREADRAEYDEEPDNEGQSQAIPGDRR